MGEEDLSISTLSDLCKDLKISLTKTNATLSQVGALSTYILLPKGVVGFFRCRRWFGEFGFEVSEAGLAVSNICEEVKIIIKKVYYSLNHATTVYRC